MKNQRIRASNLKLVLVSSTWKCNTFHNFLSMFKKTIFKSQQVFHWLAKWLIMSGYMDLKRPRVCRRSNVGLVVGWGVEGLGGWGVRVETSVLSVIQSFQYSFHDEVIKWKHFPGYWPFLRGIHWSPVNSPHKGQWRGALIFSLICAWINGWVNNHVAGNLRRHRAHYDVIVMLLPLCCVHYYRLTMTNLVLNHPCCMKR